MWRGSAVLLHSPESGPQLLQMYTEVGCSPEDVKQLSDDDIHMQQLPAIHGDIVLHDCFVLFMITRA